MEEKAVNVKTVLVLLWVLLTKRVGEELLLLLLLLLWVLVIKMVAGLLVLTLIGKMMGQEVLVITVLVGRVQWL